MSKSTITTTPAVVDAVVITPAAEMPNIVSLRTAAVESESTVYGARRAYANGINMLAGAVAWYRDGVELPIAVKAEKGEYYKALKAIGYSNPSNAWKMVKQYAFENAVELGLFGEVAKTEGGEGEVEANGETRETRTMTLRIVEELTKLHKAAEKKRTDNSEEYTDKVSKAHAKIIEALKAMGVDIGI
jgi:acylphosphatase